MSLALIKKNVPVPELWFSALNGHRPSRSYEKSPENDRGRDHQYLESLVLAAIQKCEDASNARPTDTNLSAHLELNYFYPVRDDWGFVTLVEGRVEHLYGIVVELV
jgi:hypothetical protein